MNKTHDFYSLVEIVGKVHKTSAPEEAAAQSYYYIRLIYRDENSPVKFINVFCWDSKDKAVSLNIQKGDTVFITGELGFDERNKEKPVHFIRCKDIRVVSKTEQKTPALAY